jgi:hypothetical protein
MPRAAKCNRIVDKASPGAALAVYAHFQVRHATDDAAHHLQANCAQHSCKLIPQCTMRDTQKRA